MSEDNFSPYASLFTNQPDATPGAPSPAPTPQTQLGRRLDVDSLDLPLYGAGPIVAIKRFYQNYATFSGRASRSEYWWANVILFLAVSIIFGVGIALGYTLGGGVTDEYGLQQPGPAFLPFFIIGGLLNLASIVPAIAISVRRLHDGGFSGLWYLVNFVPYIGSLVLLVFFILPPKPAGARFDRVAGVTPGYAQPQQAPFAQYAPLPPQPYGRQQPPTPGV